MKKILLAAAAMLFTACQPLEDLKTFEFSGEQEVTIPGKNLVADPLATIPLDSIDEDFNRSLSETFTNQGVDANDVDSFTLKAVSLTLHGPVDNDGRPMQDLRFLDLVRFSLSADDISDTLLTESETDAFSPGVIHYDFPVDQNQELGDFLVADSMTMTVDAEANDRPALGCDLLFKTTFVVVVNPMGLTD